MPDPRIMGLELRTHIRIIEGLFVGSLRESAVFGRNQMPSAISAATEEVRGIIRSRYLGIPAPSIATTDIILSRHGIKGEGDPAGMELGHIVLK